MLNKELVLSEKNDKPELPEIWVYDESVKKVKTVYYKAKNMNKELLTELWIARKMLSSQGQRKDLGKNFPKLNWGQYCQDIGIEKRTANMWLALFEGKVAHVSHNSGNNEWYTPPEYIDAAKAVMGTIDLDPASSEIANQTVKASEFYSIDDNGLSKEWAGNVWLNPPYAQPLVNEFSKKLIDELNNIKNACVLVNNATDTEWLQRMLKQCNAVCFIDGRVKFMDTNGKATGAPLQGQCILYFGGEMEKFFAEFSKHGTVFRTW